MIYLILNKCLDRKQEKLQRRGGKTKEKYKYQVAK